MNEPYERLVQSLKSLPGLGFRSAEKIALYLLVEKPERAKELTERISRAEEVLGPCKVCGNYLCREDTTLFDDTIKNNIKYAKEDASDEEIYKVSKLSFCDEFINNLPNKFETLIGENGVRLSGGEKQRLSIARAMLKNSKIILLDEATSSLDSETEQKIQEAINYLTEGRTTLVIAHRLSTIINASKIYVVEKGNIIANGTHEDLLNSSEIYKSFYRKQLHKNNEISL